ncbi:MAG: leucyl aminopeptidase [Planctomycetota bacterium]
MKVELTQESPFEIDADAIVVGIFNSTDGNPVIEGPVAEIDSASGGMVSKLAEAGELSAEKLSITQLLAPQGMAAPVVVIVGLGEAGRASHDLSYRAAGAAVKHLATRSRSRVAVFLNSERLDHAVCGAINGCHGQDILRQENNLHPVETLIWRTEDRAAVDKGIVLAESMLLTRRMVNLPSNEIYPETFAAECAEAGGSAGFEVEVWDEDKLAEENCGAMLAVGRASAFPPRLVIMRYNGGAENQQPLGLVGKGVTFDSGGLSIKPGPSMVDMKCDMAGAATVLGAMNAIATLKLPVNVIGFAGLAENMIGGDSYRLGDVLKSRNGKTIEVHNTDAEGRLVLADVLDVAVQSGCAKLIDLATLTGACMVALGKDIVGLMANDNDWADAVYSAADDSTERVWPLPMFPEFGEQLKSKVADLKNIGEGRWGGAITAGKFLEEFVRGTPWVHLDIAGPAFADKPSAWIDAGASGCMVRTLVEVARRYEQAE